MKLQKLIIILSSLIAVLGLTACGNGGSDASFSDGEQKIDIDINCTTPAQVETYINLYSGDTIVKKEDNTSISTYHDTNGTKKVCLVSGSAYILRK